MESARRGVFGRKGGFPPPSQEKEGGRREHISRLAHLLLLSPLLSIENKPGNKKALLLLYTNNDGSSLLQTFLGPIIAQNRKGEERRRRGFLSPVAFWQREMGDENGGAVLSFVCERIFCRNKEGFNDWASCEISEIFFGGTYTSFSL